MNKYFIYILLVLFHIGCANAESGESVVENSIGKLLLLHDKKYSYQDDLNPFGSAEVYKEFLILYEEKIKTLPKTDRINYFWSSMWHLGFDGHYMEEFQELVMKDCGNIFIEKLQNYVDKESELKRDKSRLYLSEKVLAGLKLIQERSNK